MDKVVISTMATGGVLPVDWAGWKSFEWSGKPTARGYTGWSAVAAALRDRGTGRLLPNLLKNYNMSPDSMVVAVGFSAGSNDGLRELLRNAEDRNQIVAAVAVDGAHWNQKKQGATDPKDYWDWKGEAGPFDQMAQLAATSGKPFVTTASMVAAPVVPKQILSTTREALASISGTTLGATGIAKSSPPGMFAVPLTGTVKGQQVSKAPIDGWSQGGFVASVWPGNQPNDHIWQANTLVPQALAYLRAKGIT